MSYRSCHERNHVRAAGADAKVFRVRPPSRCTLSPCRTCTSGGWRSRRIRPGCNGRAETAVDQTAKAMGRKLTLRMYLAVALSFITSLFSLYRLSMCSFRSVLFERTSQLTPRLVACRSRRPDQLRPLLGSDSTRGPHGASPRPIQSARKMGRARSSERGRLGAQE